MKRLCGLANSCVCSIKTFTFETSHIDNKNLKALGTVLSLSCIFFDNKGIILKKKNHISKCFSFTRENFTTLSVFLLRFLFSPNLERLPFVRKFRRKISVKCCWYFVFVSENRNGIELYHLQNTGKFFAFSRPEAWHW